MTHCVSSRALHRSMGRSFSTSRANVSGLLVQIGFFVQHHPWVFSVLNGPICDCGLFHGFWLGLNGPFCGQLFHGFWLGWLLCEPSLMVLTLLSSWRWPLRVACWLFTASLWRTDVIAFSKFNVESICSLSDSVTSLIPTTMQSRHGVPCSHSVPWGRIGRWWTNQPSRRPFAYAGWIWPSCIWHCVTW